MSENPRNFFPAYSNGAAKTTFIDPLDTWRVSIDRKTTSFSVSQSNMYSSVQCTVYCTLYTVQYTVQCTIHVSISIFTVPCAICLFSQQTLRVWPLDKPDSPCKHIVKIKKKHTLLLYYTSLSHMFQKYFSGKIRILR